MDHDAGTGRRELQEGNAGKVKGELLEYQEWMFWNSEHLEFIDKLDAEGRLDASQRCPDLDQDGHDLWQMYCFTGDDILMSVDVYEKRIGIPPDWEFEDCVLLIADMKRNAQKLTELKRNDRRD